jgi:hypothetical protein
MDVLVEIKKCNETKEVGAKSIQKNRKNVKLFVKKIIKNTD